MSTFGHAAFAQGSSTFERPVYEVMNSVLTRANSKVPDTLPDLKPSLSEQPANLNSILKNNKISHRKTKDTNLSNQFLSAFFKQNEVDNGYDIIKGI